MRCINIIDMCIYMHAWVQGCDASILIDPVNGNNTVEKNAIPNRSIAGYEVIDEIKEKLGQLCPRAQVSCADIVSLAARDAVSFQVCYHNINVFYMYELPAYLPN